MALAVLVAFVAIVAVGVSLAAAVAIERLSAGATLRVRLTRGSWAASLALVALVVVRFVTVLT